jgi:hypothetical protein
MTQSELEALLGRSLTSSEVTNLTLYLEIATSNLNDLLCTTTNEVTESRTFDTRNGYKTAFVGIVQSVTEIKLDDDVISNDGYSLRQWDKRTAGWYNAVVFDDAITADEITVTGTWGFASGTLPNDLNMVLAGLFDLITKRNKFDGTIASKRVEDFQINFNTDADLDGEFYDKYSNILSKYSVCDIPNIQSGAITCL